MSYKAIFDKYKTIAVYGMSTNPAKPSNYVPAFLESAGFIIIPINPVAKEIVGKTVYPKLIDVPVQIEILDVFRPSEQALDVVREAVERKKANGDIEVIWLQEGIINDDAKKLAEENGIQFVQDRCMKVEYQNL
ncbi:MAG: CoA-binding protein [Ignavibacteriae bacterium]|nr:CoA-binding protein [Ignavibacteriota bacterium]